MLTLDQPDKSNLRFLRDWLVEPKKGNCFLRGREAATWDTEYTHDIISLRKQNPENDPFSNWLIQRFVGWFHRWFGYRYKVRFIPSMCAFLSVSANEHEPLRHQSALMLRARLQTIRKRNFTTRSTSLSPSSPVSSQIRPSLYCIMSPE